MFPNHLILCARHSVTYAKMSHRNTDSVSNTKQNSRNYISVT